MADGVSTDTTGAELIARDVKHVLHPLHDKKLTETGKVWVKGEGCWLIDSEGQRYFDGLSGLHNVTLGQGRRELIEAATKQMEQLAYASPYSGGATEPAIELASRLSSLCYPSINRFFFTSGGGESTDSSIKLARSYWKAVGKPGKHKVISLMGAYHGVTLGAMCATGMPAYWSAFEPRMPGFVHIPNHDIYRYEAAEGKGPESAADELEKAILAEGADSVAMFIIEPVLGGGALVAPDGYFQRIREICDKYEVLLVADEVITGFGRTGKLFALEHWGVEPDMFQFAKGVTSGYVQLGGVGVSDKIAAAIDSAETGPWMHAYTYSGHPVACAVALATLDVLEKDGIVENARVRGAELKAALTQKLGQHPHVGIVRGLGLQLGIDLVADRETKAEFPSSEKVGPRVVDACREMGLFTRGRGDQIYLSPPLISTAEDVAYIADTLDKAVRQVLG